jgi:hypothetical protein
MVHIYMAYTTTRGIRFCKALSKKQARKIIEDNIFRDAVNESRNGKNTSIRCNEKIISIELYQYSYN